MMSTAKLSTSNGQGLQVPEGLGLEKGAYLELYALMITNRKLEERLGTLYRQNLIVGGLYSSLGQEAISVGSAYALEEGDYLAPMIRNLGSMLVRGFTPLEVFLQYLGRKSGPTRGKEGNLHFGALGKRVIAPISMLGSLIPVMAGIALVIKNKGEPHITLTHIGDGGTSTSDFHEGLNLAAVLRLPFVLVVENNLFAYSTPISKQMNISDITLRAKAYGIHGEMVDGNNVLAVYEATRRARDLCLRGEGPVLLECKTFRRKGHAEHDDASYVPKQLKEKWAKRDPIESYAAYLLGKEIASGEELRAIDDKISGELEEDVKRAIADPFPEPEDALAGVYRASGRKEKRNG